MVAPPLFASHHEHVHDPLNTPSHFAHGQPGVISIKEQEGQQRTGLCGGGNLVGACDDSQSDSLKIQNPAQPRFAPLAPQTPPTLDASSPTVLLDSNIDLDKFEQLVNDIKVVLGPTNGIDDIDVDHLMKIMKEYDPTSCEDEWNKYALNDPSRNYTRNGVDDINKKANLLILVWNPQRGSMIHDHANAHCIVKLLKGRLRETLYDWPHSDHEELTEKKVTDVEVGQVTYMSDEIGLHRMYNPHESEVAVSMHLYTPPYAAKFGCHIYDQESGKSHKVNMSTLYSNKGVLCGKPSDTC